MGRKSFLMVCKFCTVTELLHTIIFRFNKIVKIKKLFCNILQNNFITLRSRVIRV